MTESQPDEKPELVVDEDWKSQVQAENETIDASFTGEAEEADQKPKGRNEKIDPSQIPPASFPLLISMFSTQAMTALGLLPHPITGKAEYQPALAKHYIDLLAVLDEKTKGNLSAQEHAMLENSLHELRLVFVQQSSRNA
ncbi:MAG: DUF1844 domain-containing protein [Planctomycetaceae bacterium]|nr:DUF1844 domain-containing protein [Planctomycetaceae bacterium]